MRRGRKKAQPQRKKRSPMSLLTILSRHFLLYLVVVIVTVALEAFAIFRMTSSLKPVIETPKNEVAKVPADVKKNIEKEKDLSLLATVRVPILMYHYVEYVQDKKDTIRQALDVTPDIFEDQMKSLREAGYTFMTAEELGAVLDGKTQLPEKPIVITFDDGHWDLDTIVLPILKKYNIKATAYIISGFLGGSDFLTSQQLHDVINSGLVEIGAHTVHHLALKGLPPSVVTSEITQSKKDLEMEYHLHVVSFAYPSGSFDQQAIDTVKAAGFTTAMSTIPGIEQSQINRFFLYRLRPGYRSGADLLSFLQQNNFIP